MTDRQEQFEQAAEAWIKNQRDQFRADAQVLDFLNGEDPATIHDDDVPELRRLVERSSLEWDWEEFIEDKSYDDVVIFFEEYHQGYGLSLTTTVRIDLMGSGPAGWLELDFDSDNDLVGGRLAYNDWFQQAHKVALDMSELEQIMQVMNVSGDLLLEAE